MQGTCFNNVQEERRGKQSRGQGEKIKGGSREWKDYTSSLSALVAGCPVTAVLEALASLPLPLLDAATSLRPTLCWLSLPPAELAQPHTCPTSVAPFRALPQTSREGKFPLGHWTVNKYCWNMSICCLCYRSMTCAEEKTARTWEELMVSQLCA